MTWFAVHLGSIAIVFATLIGPVLAVQAQKYLERHRDQKRAKDSIFRVLMATRASRLSPDHVQALNGIDLAYYSGGIREKRVRESWKAYHDLLNTRFAKEREGEWVTRQLDLFVDLLHEMAVCLGYDFDKTYIKNSSYAPEAFGTIEQEVNLIRGALAEILVGKRPFQVVGVAASEDEARQTAEIRGLLIEWLRVSSSKAAMKP